MTETVFSQIISKLADIIKECENEQKNFPGEMHLLQHFRHRYENSHSDVLAYLLNPDEQHKHGSEFLELFLKELSWESLYTKGEKFSIHREYTTENGRIDLYIKFKNACLILENKLDAKDRENQLSDYYTQATHERFSEENIYVAYLTLYGSSPSKDSISSEKLKNLHHYQNISYKKHILNWLYKVEESIDSLQEPLLFSAIHQYKHNIEVITHQTKGDNMERKEIAKLLFQKEHHGIASLLLELESKLLSTISALQVREELAEELKDMQPFYFINLEEIQFEEIELEELKKYLGEKLYSFGIGIKVPNINIENFTKNQLSDVAILYEYTVTKEHQIGLGKLNNHTELDTEEIKSICGVYNKVNAKDGENIEFYSPQTDSPFWYVMGQLNLTHDYPDNVEVLVDWLKTIYIILNSTEK